VRLNTVAVGLRILGFLLLAAIVSILASGLALGAFGDRRLWYAAGGCILFAVLLSWPLARSFTFPLRKLRKSMDSLADGHGELIPEITETDAIGDTMKSFNRVVQTVDRAVRGKDIQVEHVKMSVQKTERTAAELGVLYDIAHQVMGIHVLGELFSVGLSHVVRIVDLEWAYAMRYDREAEEFVMEKVVGFEPSAAREIQKLFHIKNRFPADRTIAEIVRHEKVPLLSHREARELVFKDFEEFCDLKTPVKTFCCVPIGTGEEFVGVLGFVNKKDEIKFSRPDQEFMIQLASLVEAGYRRIQMFETGFVDETTGLFRPEYFKQRLLEEMAFSRRYNTQMAVLDVSVDNAPEHASDLTVLTRQVGAVLNKHLRVIDVITSPSPGTFWIIFSDTDPEGALIGAGRIREKIEDTSFGDPDNPTVCTVSCGIAPYRAQKARGETLIKTAAAALGEAREKGGNRAACADIILEDEPAEDEPPPAESGASG